MRGPVRLLLAAAAMCATAAIAPQASAAPTALADCAPGSVCGWTGTFYTGTKSTFTGSCTDTLISSIANTYGSPGIPAAAWVYSQPGCTGTVLARVGPGQSSPAFSGYGRSVAIYY